MFDFESNAVNTPTPFTDTVEGLSATFTGAASVCNFPGLFATLTGNFLIQGFCGPGTESGPLGISFSSDLGGVFFNFAIEAGGRLTVQGFENATLVGTATFASTVPSGRFNGEGIASLTGVFNRLVLTSDRLLGLDNVDAMPVAVPEPAGPQVAAEQKVRFSSVRTPAR